MSFRFVEDVPLRWVDVDSEGVVNNAVYLSLMEQARYLYFDRLGLLSKGRIEFLLAEVTVRFLRPGRLGMRTRVAARTARLGRSSFKMMFEVRAGEETLATGEVALVYVDAAMRPREIPSAVREAVAGFEGIPPRAD